MSAPDPQERKQVRVGIYGYGEVGHGLALGLIKVGLQSVVAFQRNPQRPLIAGRVRESGVRLVSSALELAAQADLIIAVTQGAPSVQAARDIRAGLSARHCYVDLASTSPKVKLDIEAVLDGSGALFSDGAVEGSPLEYEHRMPLIVSGPGAQRFHDLMTPWGMQIQIVSPDTGKAMAIKGLRNVLTKGQIALLVECTIAARRMGISEQVLGSVAEWYDARPFMTNANRLMRTTAVHAERRADEAELAMGILEDLGVEPLMTRATVETLRRIGALGLREQLGGMLPETADDAIELMQAYNNPHPQRP